MGRIELMEAQRLRAKKAAAKKKAEAKAKPKVEMMKKRLARFMEETKAKTDARMMRSLTAPLKKIEDTKFFMMGGSNTKAQKPSPPDTPPADKSKSKASNKAVEGGYTISAKYRKPKVNKAGPASLGTKLTPSQRAERERAAKNVSRPKNKAGLASLGKKLTPSERAEREKAAKNVVTMHRGGSRASSGTKRTTSGTKEGATRRSRQGSKYVTQVYRNGKWVTKK